MAHFSGLEPLNPQWTYLILLGHFSMCKFLTYRDATKGSLKITV